MIEPEAVIDPEAGSSPGGRGRRRRAVIAAATLLAMAAAGIAVAAGRGGSEPKPLALMAGDGRSSAGGFAEAQTTAAPALAPGAPADSKLVGPAPYGGLKFEVGGDLPDLPDHAAAWRVSGPALDRAAVARIATALALTGDPVQRDGGWFVDSGDWQLAAYGGGDTWSVNLFRSRYAGGPDDAGTADNTPAGAAISRAEAEQRVRDLLARMGAPTATWTLETTETELGIGWACAAPAPSVAPAAGSSIAAATPAMPAQPAVAPVPADKPMPGGAASCPPPPPPAKGFSVALHPVLDGRRADWAVWTVTLRSDGRIENLYGSWVSFEHGDNYRLRGVDAAVEELQSPVSPPIAYATDTPAIANDGRAFANGVAAVEPAPSATSGAGGAVTGTATGSAPSRLPLVDPAAPSVGSPDVPVCPPVAMPLRAEDDKAASSMPAGCAQAAPHVVRITGVELGLMQTSVFEGGRVHLALIPTYRFTGHFDDGSAWETSVIALHPDAIAPPPNGVVDDVRSGGGTGVGVNGSGKAVPPMPPAADQGSR